MPSATTFPTKYSDPQYEAADTASAARNGIPLPLLRSIRTVGERSNADQVSAAGARTPYQITPATRKLALDKWGIDAYLSPENASEVAALVLKDSLARNGGDPVQAAGEYHGGTDRANWGPKTDSYMRRIGNNLDAQRVAEIARGYAQYQAQLKAKKAAEKAQETADATPQANDAMAQGFGQFLQDKAAQPPPKAEPTLVDRAVGAGEAGLATIVGGGVDLAGQAGSLIGSSTARAVEGVKDALSGDTTISPETAANIQANMATNAGARVAAPFMPRTEQGQQQLAAVGEAMDAVTPALPLTAEVGAITSGAADAAAAARAGARGNAGAIVDAVRRPVDAALNAVVPGRTDAAALRDSASAMRAADATVRQTRAANLPVPIDDLTVGQATRDAGQQAFERETAKNPELGGEIRDRMASHNEKLQLNLDHMLDSTEAEAAGPREVGEAVTDALRAKLAADKKRMKDAYKAAEAAGEMEAPVTLNTVVDALNNTGGREKLAGTNIPALRQSAIDTGIATEAADGSLVAQPTTLKNGEIFRRNLSGLTNDDPTNIRNSTIIRGLYDDATDSVGGQKYQRARAMRRLIANRFENNGLVRDILGTKRGTNDRRIALENVVDKAVLNDSASLDSLTHLGRLLQRSGTAGQQAWKEIQGEVIRQIKAKATTQASDHTGGRIISSAALDKALAKLDKGGKLDYLFGKKNAQTLRDINDVARDVHTTVPGMVNHSNTAATILAALDMVVSGHLGIPAPILSSMRVIVKHVKDKNLRARITSALNDAKIQKAPPTPAAAASPGSMPPPVVLSSEFTKNIPRQ